MCVYIYILYIYIHSGTSVLWSSTGLSHSDHNSEMTLIVNMGTEASWDIEKCHIEQVYHGGCNVVVVLLMYVNTCTLYWLFITFVKYINKTHKM